MTEMAAFVLTLVTCVAFGAVWVAGIVLMKRVLGVEERPEPEPTPAVEPDVHRPEGGAV
jgi:hypothetical protein